MLVSVMSYMMYMQGQDPLAPLRSVAGGIGDQFNQAGSSVRKSVANAGVMMSLDADGTTVGSTQRIYRWEDANGITHFGTFKPESDINYRTVDVNPNSNVMDAYNTPVSSPKQLTAQEGNLPGAPKVAPVPMSANPSKIREMLDNVNKLSESRLQKLEAIH